MEQSLNNLKPPKRRTVADLTKENCDEIIRLYQENISKTEICRRTGFYWDTINRVIQGYKPYLRERPRKLSFEKVKAILLLSQENKSDFEIAQALDISPVVVKKYRKKYGTPASDSIRKKGSKNNHTKASEYARMQKHLRFDVPIEWFLQYPDFRKLCYLNSLVADRKDTFTRRTRYDETTEWYKSFIEKFYNDSRFNYLYDNWREKGDNLLRPVLSHAIPPSKGGTNELGNLSTVTYFENACRKTVDQEKWDYIKAHIGEFFL